METKPDSKSSLAQKQFPHHFSYEAITLGHNNIPHQINTNHHGTMSEAIYPFSIAASTAARLFEIPNNNNNEETSTDDADHREASVISRANNERRMKRMISNRESARRSRMRRKMQIEELQYLVVQLQNTNRQLSEKLIQLLDCNQQILHDNSQLKEKVSSLQILLSEFLVPLRNVSEDHNSSGAGDRALRAQGSSTPVTTITSMHLLH